MKNLQQLNEEYASLSAGERITRLYQDFDKVLFTSSFGTTSAILLDLVKRVNPKQVVHFIDTTYHFRETLAYKNKLTKLLDLNIEVLKAEKWKNDFTWNEELWRKDADLCCSINKVEPVENIQGDYHVWISGLMHWQSTSRKEREIFEEKNGIIKFHPLIDWSEEEANLYYEMNYLPLHPLTRLGYQSVGCFYCTRQGKKREGRWNNTLKTECGLHV